jgi:Zn-finger nucleic acid-binding protein
MSRMCPDCDAPLAPETAHGVTVDACPQCAGIWFDDSEYGRLKTVASSALFALEDRLVPQAERLAQGSHERRCPACSMVMFRYRYLYNSPVELDGCERCNGVWVEDGELRKMSEALAAVRTAKDTAAERKAEALAQFAVEHEAEMDRQSALRSFFSAISVRWPWYGPAR